MCYLKNLGAQEQVDFDDFFSKNEDPSAESSEQEVNVLIPCVEKQGKAIWSEEQQMLVNLFDLIQKNNHMISALNQTLEHNSEEIEKISIQTKSQTQNAISSESYISNKSTKKQTPSKKPQTLEEKIFGAKDYKYSLSCSSEKLSTLYKERNFRLAVDLLDQEGKNVRNCNMINLCFAICDSNGEWIHENKNGENFIKGKTEVELFKGEASFEKLYARDVSRIYPEGKINLVIYAKPSALLYSQSSSFESCANPEEIRPLIIEDIVIKAKKKE